MRRFSRKKPVVLQGIGLLCAGSLAGTLQCGCVATTNKQHVVAASTSDAYKDYKFKTLIVRLRQTSKSSPYDDSKGGGMERDTWAVTINGRLLPVSQIAKQLGTDFELPEASWDSNSGTPLITYKLFAAAAVAAVATHIRDIEILVSRADKPIPVMVTLAGMGTFEGTMSERAHEAHE
jgi:hypothetical protein